MRLFFLLFFMTTTLIFADCVYDDSNRRDTRNDSYPGVTISEMDNITDSTSYTLCGESEDDDEDYYNFTVNAEGNLTITTSSPNNEIYRIQIWVDDNELYYHKSESITRTFPLKDGDRVVIYFKESGSELDKYEATFDFVQGPTGEYNIGGNRPFTVRNPEETRNISGNYAIIGNANLCAINSNREDAPWTGTCYDDNDNDLAARYIDIDSDSTTKNSSSLDIAAFEVDQARVVWAGLYWQGVVHNSIRSGDFMGDSGDDNGLTITDEPIMYETQLDFWESSSTYDAEKILFKIPGGEYQEITADVFDFYKLGYAGFKNVTDIINKYNPNGDYYVANIKSNQGVEDEHGNYAAWALVVIYEDNQEGYKNITLFDGYATVDEHFNQDLLIKGFLTPRTPPIESKLAVFAMDGDNGDNSLTIINQAGEATEVTNQDNSSHSLFDSTISQSITRTPDTTSLRTDLKVLNLVDVLNPLETEAILRPRTENDRYTPSFFIMSADLFVPKFCYDYAYQQQGIYFTEENDGTQQPRIIGDVQVQEPIEVKVYVRNQVESDIDITDMNVSVLDINTTQAKYIRDTTALAKDGDIIATAIDDSDLDVSDAYIKDIPIGTISSNEFFYLYYQLEPQRSDLNMSLAVRADYLLSVDGGDPIPYNLTLGNDPENIPMCSSSNFQYQPAKGIFNIVHNDYYNLDDGGSNQYYNLPTQVSSRVGNFKVISMDPENLDDLKANSTIVAVDMIDASAFHDTNTSCAELSSAITKRVWVQIGDEDTNATSAPFNLEALQAAINSEYTDITTPEEFYKTARQNTAFRISYNTMDENGSIPYISKVNNGSLLSLNWREEWTGEECHTPMGDTGISEDVRNKTATYCNATKNTFDIKDCMECIYGLHTKVVCSRDNFAIRPEAFKLHLKDQNQSNPSQQSDVTSLSDSGSSGAIAPELHLAAGYEYNLEVNATNHIDNTSTPGYTRSFNVDSTTLSTYKWAPQSGHDVSGCNAPTDVNTSMRFVDGKVDVNSSLNNVGHYTLMLKDTSWTLVDYDSNFMTHHTGEYFLSSSVADCKTNSNLVLNTGATMSYNTSNNDDATLNGCNITSNHNNSEANIQYNDFNVTFHPYQFTLNLTASVGMNRSNTLTQNSTAYIYYADIFQPQDENMSYQLDGIITAEGYNGVKLSNFVNACYSKPLNLHMVTLNRDLNDTSGAPVLYQARFHDLNDTDMSAAVIQSALDINASFNATNPVDINTTQAHFVSSLKGDMSTLLSLNYKRTKNVAINPHDLTFVKYEVKCVDSTECSFDANLTTMETEGLKDLNNTIHHYYGRTHVTRQRYSGADGNATIYYEVFCYGDECRKELLQDGNTSTFSDDPRWFINTHHTPAFGVPGEAVQKTSPTYVTATTSSDKKTFTLQYNGSYYPYKTTMENNASGWLIYNKYKPSATTNSFEVEFTKANGDWAGIRETNTTTKRNASDITSRRTLW